jgi:membrane-anchored protein YejM (alkaline phosphatase superfamily)
MQRTARKGQWTNRFDEIDRDKQLKQVLDTLENENSMLKTLVVRLSEIVVRNAVAKKQ